MTSQTIVKLHLRSYHLFGGDAQAIEGSLEICAMHRAVLIEAMIFFERILKGRD